MPKRRNDNAPYYCQLRKAEADMVEYALKCAGTVRAAAEMLGVSKSYLSIRLRVLRSHELIVWPKPKKKRKIFDPPTERDPDSDAEFDANRTAQDDVVAEAFAAFEALGVRPGADDDDADADADADDDDTDDDDNDDDDDVYIDPHMVTPPRTPAPSRPNGDRSQAAPVLDLRALKRAAEVAAADLDDGIIDDDE